MMNKMHKYLLLALAMPFVLASCAREIEIIDDSQVIDEHAVTSGVRPVTITAGLPPETKITHVYDNSKLKPYWEENDQVEVSFEVNGTAVVETFTLKDGAGTQSATFYKEDSQLTDGIEFSVDYVDKDYSDGWAVQDGLAADLPECLSASGLTLPMTEPAPLTPALTYLHVIVTIPEGESYANAYLSKLEGAFTMYSAPGTKGVITVTPASAFSGNVDMFVAMKLDGDTSANGTDTFGATVSPKFQIAFGNGTQGLSLDGQAVSLAGAHYKYNWTPASTYAAGKVYKISGKTFTSVSAAQAMPR